MVLSGTSSMIKKFLSPLQSKVFYIKISSAYAMNIVCLCLKQWPSCKPEVNRFPELEWLYEGWDGMFVIELPSSKRLKGLQNHRDIIFYNGMHRQRRQDGSLWLKVDTRQFCQLTHTRYFNDSCLVGSDLKKCPIHCFHLLTKPLTMKTRASLVINRVLPMVTRPSNPPTQSIYFIIKQDWKLINTFFEYHEKLM